MVNMILMFFFSSRRRHTRSLLYWSSDVCSSDLSTVDRSIQAGDVAVINYTGASEGKSLAEIAPSAGRLAEQKNFWVDVPSNSFIPGFADQLLGAKAGDRRTVTVDFPPDFMTPELAGKKAAYEVEVVEVKARVLPPLDE